jgi:hypothetical protein
MVLKNKLYVPKLDTSLLSARYLYKVGFSWIFQFRHNVFQAEWENNY